MYLQRDYLGSSRLHRTTNHGQTWQRIDTLLLTFEDDRGIEVFNSFFLNGKIFLYHKYSVYNNQDENLIRSKPDGSSPIILQTTKRIFNEKHGNAPIYSK